MSGESISESVVVPVMPVIETLAPGPGDYGVQAGHFRAVRSALEGGLGPRALRHESGEAQDALSL